jgi:hypothetical protein
LAMLKVRRVLITEAILAQVCSMWRRALQPGKKRLR